MSLRRVGPLLAVFAAVMRRNLHETEAFVEAKKLAKPTGSIRGLLNYPRELLLVVGLTAGGTAAFYTFTTYMQKYLVNTAGMDAKVASTVMTLVLPGRDPHAPADAMRHLSTLSSSSPGASTPFSVRTVSTE